MNDLIIRITGAVESSNFDAFQKSALSVISEINTDLVTDEDFLDAEETIKLLKATEDKLWQAKQDGINQTEDIANLFTLIDQLSGSCRETRLSLGKSVKTEKEKRKKEVIDRALETLVETVESSPVTHGFEIDFNAIRDAIKGKRSLDKMEEAVGEAVENQIAMLDQLARRFESNIKIIAKTEEEFSSLFPDKKTIALSLEETVEAIIGNRVNKFKLDQAEKKKREEEAEKAKVELEKRRVEEAEKARIEQEKRTAAMMEKPPEIEPQKAPKKAEIQPEPEKQVKETFKPASDLKENYSLMVEIYGTREDAVWVANEVNPILGGVPCVRRISLNKGA